MNREKYLRAVRRRLNMPKQWKDRVIADFASSIEARIEEGQQEADILEELGAPKVAARELNTQMQEYTYMKSPWRWACLGLAIVSGLSLAYRGLPGLLLMLFNKANNASIGIIGGADGPTSVFITTATTDTPFPAGMFYVLLLAMGLLGFFALRKLSRK